jgi:formylglycine-generating enzyme required for sulfatase activity
MNRSISSILLLLCLAAPMASAGTDIFSAVKNDDISSLIFILNSVGYEKASAKGQNGVTPLHIAAALNKPDIVAILVSFGANVDTPTQNGFTPLHWAASRDAVKSLQSLLREGADTDIMTPTGITPLHWAASKNATNAVAFLLAHKGDIHSKTVSGLRPLHWAVMKESDDAANMLADVEVSRKIERDVITAAPFEPDETTDSSVPQEEFSIHVPSPVMTPTIHKGHSFTIPLGTGEELSFIWLESLKLWFGKYELTNGQYRRYKLSHTSMFVESISLDQDDQPAVFVTWNEAKKYCNWLNNNYSEAIPDGWIFRLPTSMEWMYSAQCGTERKYPWGDDWPPLHGNYSDLSAKKVLPNWRGIPNYNDGFPATCPVIYSGTNEWGLCGMGGNVWEWCEDWYGRDKKNKIRHGGGWDFDTKDSLSIDYKGFDRPNMKYDTVGFRIVIAKRQSKK